jgi:hypothetical protein
MFFSEKSYLYNIGHSELSENPDMPAFVPAPPPPPNSDSLPGLDTPPRESARRREGY